MFGFPVHTKKTRTSFGVLFKAKDKAAMAGVKEPDVRGGGGEGVCVWGGVAAIGPDIQSTTPRPYSGVCAGGE